MKIKKLCGLLTILKKSNRKNLKNVLNKSKENVLNPLIKNIKEIQPLAGWKTGMV